MIRPMTRTDLPVVTALEEQIYSQPWSPNVFESEIDRTDRAYVVVDEEGAVVGYAGMLFVEDDAHVTTMAVSPTARRGRYGTRLMLALIAEALHRGARNLTLEVRASNDAAQRLYDRFGMSKVGLRKNYYRDEDAVIMWANDIDSEEYADRLRSIEEGLNG